MNEIEFEIKNSAAYGQNDMAYNMAQIAHDTYSNVAGFSQTGIWSKLRQIDLSNYYTNGGSGAKITKSLRTILINEIGKEAVEARFAEFCKQISELYLPAFTLRTYWGDKNDLGEGVWESGQTCFSHDGCNEQNKKFLVRFNRVRVLALNADTSERKVRARAIVYFASGREIFMGNFYYRNFPNNKLIFVEALRRILNLKKLTYKSEHFPLPIYANGDGIVLHTDRQAKKRAILYPCTVCGAKTEEIETREVKNTIYIACSQDCIDELDGNYTVCANCNERINGNTYATPSGEDYCEDCYQEYCFTCAACDEVKWVDDCVGDAYCDDCAFACGDCEAVTHNDNGIEVNGTWYCEDCISICDECDGTYLNNDIDENGHCADCAKEMEAEIEN